MTISNLSTLDYYSTAISSNATNKSKQTNPLSNALSTVEEDLQSGDTTDASSVVSEILSNATNSTSDSSSSTDSTDSADSSNPASEITDYLKTLQSAISSGDTSSAEGILSKLNDYLAANAAFQPTGAGTYSSDGTVTAASTTTDSALSALV